MPPPPTEGAKRLQSKVIPSSDSAILDRSPERNRRKGKWTTERPDAEVANIISTEEDGKRRRRLQDPLPLEDPADALHAESGGRVFKRGRRDRGDPSDVPEHNIDPEYVPRSGYFFEHDDRSRRAFTQNSRFPQNSRRRSFDWRHGSSSGRRDDHWSAEAQTQEVSDKKTDGRWNHDRFLEQEAEKDTDRKKEGKPELQDSLKEREGEKKTEPLRNSENSNVEPQRIDRGKFERRPGNYPDDRRFPGREDRNRGIWAERSRGGRGRRFAGRGWGGRDNEGHAHDKWKHDMFEESNDISRAKLEEERMAKIEALLAA